MDLEKKYLTGIIWQDYQHSKLINLMDKLKQSRSDGSDVHTFNYAIAFLVMYINDHFDLEEAYMKEYNYLDTEYHIQEHTRFIKRVKNLRENHHTHSNEAMTILINDISDWVKTHIMQNDIKLGKFILSKEKEKYHSLK